MTKHTMADHLPNNLSDWPEDVYTLLGVDRDADAKGLRRAYTRLIREYKPDHHPAEFQRIREAYDAARHFAELRLAFEPVDGDWSDVPAPTVGNDTDSDSDESVSDDSSASGNGSPVLLRRSNTGGSHFDEPADATDADAAWRRGREGDLIGAKSQLEELHARDPNNEEVIVRLYWVRKLLPASADESPSDVVDWLCGIAKRRGLRGRPWQLLVEELQAAPVLSRGEAASVLLGSPDSNDQLVPLLMTRWQSSGRVQRWSAIDDDLQAVRGLFLPDSPVAWVETVLAALRILVWSRDVVATGYEVDGVLQLGTPLFERWFEELNAFEELHLTHPHVFDERDELVELREQIDRQQVRGRVRHLLLEDTVGRGVSIRNRILNMARDWNMFPSKALDELDQMAQFCPMVLARLWQCVARHNSAGWFIPEGQGDVIVQQVDRMIQATNWNSIPEARIAVYEFCVRESLPLRQVAHAVTQSRVLNTETMETLSGFFYGDAALACLCECVQAGHCQ